MDNLPLRSLRSALLRLRESAPDQLVSSLRELPEPGVLPSPWQTWTLIGLIRHRQRQQWVAEIIRTRLRGELDVLAALGALGHPDGVLQRGPVPGIPEWEYFYHGIGCCLTHKVEGDSIDVDFFDSTADYFSTFFYTNYLKSLRRPEAIEQRLCELHPSLRTVTFAVTDLLAAGALTPLPGKESHPYRLSDEVMLIADDVDSFCEAWLDADRRVWLAALIGDWLAADAATADQPDLSAITAPRARQCREMRQKRLCRDLDEEYRGADALWALVDLQPSNLDKFLEDALCRRPSGIVSAALDIIGQHDCPRWCGRVYELFSRLHPAGQHPRPHLWIRTVKFLLRHRYQAAEVTASLANANGTEVGEAVLLSLEHAPALALPLIRRGLLSEVPLNRTQVAATLALIDAPWSMRELLAALESSDDQEKTADARAALLESGHETLKKAVLAWEEQNPHEKEIGSYLEIGGRRLGPFYTFAEMSLRNRVSWIKYEMDKLHDRVQKVKNIVPPEPSNSRRWWKFWAN